MSKDPKPVKTVNLTARFRCAGGTGIIREEVWSDTAGAVVRYNLAFILPHVQYADHGRVLGYDNHHGYPERHYRGAVVGVPYLSYRETRTKFIAEVETMRRDYGS